MNPKITVLSISSTRTKEDDKSGMILKDLVVNAGFELVGYDIIIDDKKLIYEGFQKFSSDCDVILSTGGTGCTMDDCTPEASLDFIDQRLHS